MPDTVTDIASLVDALKRYNAAYRSGRPIISDHKYDDLVEQLRAMDPSNPYLLSIEPEQFEDRREIRHPAPMLSIDKSYTPDDLQRFINRVKKEAADIGIHEVSFTVTPKLDGLAGRDDGKIFTTRGNGEVGYEISSAFAKGVIPVGGRGHGIGEIVILKSYFDQHLSDKFEHPRNMVVGIISSDTLNEFAQKALEDKAVHFVPYIKLPSWTGTDEALLEESDSITRDLSARSDYPIDGMVASVTDERVRARMGATAHHYRWQIAIKTRGETARTQVEEIRWQVGRTGNVTPVMMVHPVSLSGATIRRVTAHHAGKIEELKIGPGAEIEIIRSGEVIPKLEKVISPSSHVRIPDHCPSCSTELEWENDFLKCINFSCPAQIEQGIYHWFKTLGTADWFGIKTVRRLVENGYDRLEKIYSMKENDFLNLAFGPVQSRNLFEAINTSKTKSVEDWRFLAAFGIPALGKGDSRKLLSHIPLERLQDMAADDLLEIHGFGTITSRSIEKGLAKIKPSMTHMLDLGFMLERTPIDIPAASVDSPVSGKGILFTGKMLSGSRDEMKKQAIKLGAKVQSSVSGKTDYLVCGEKPGENKIKKARALNVQILSESDYRDMIEATAV
jgi:DNA ligase (NAD+)